LILDNELKSTEKNSSQEGFDISPINEMKRVTNFEGETEYNVSWTGHREGRHGENGQLQMADSIEVLDELFLNI
jgi:hypothetical protein